MATLARVRELRWLRGAALAAALAAQACSSDGAREAARTQEPAAGSPAPDSDPDPDPDPDSDPDSDPDPAALKPVCSVGARASCCPDFEARLRARADADPCWFEFPGIQGTAASQRFIDCVGIQDCGSVQCESLEPPSRRAGLIAADDSCTFADECSTDADCVLAYDGSAFCDCPSSTPAVLLTENPCQIAADSPQDEIPTVCDRARFTGACAPCPVLPAPRCEESGGLRLCK
jgi:hypothetical protein